MKQAHHIGIDFGTSKTLVSHINPQTKRPETLRLGRGCDYLPTSVYIDTTGQLFFGDEAEPTKRKGVIAGHEVPWRPR